MFSIPFLFVFLCWVSTCFVAASSPSRYLARANQPKLPCLKIMAEVNQEKTFFDAAEVAACITRVPFGPNTASRFLDYWNQTLQYQSTLDVLKNPGPDYQRDSVDVQKELQIIRDKIKIGYYNQYEFEKDLQILITKMHDVHVSLDAGLLAAFKFASPFDLVSASPDGKKPPRLYLRDDILAAKQGSPLSHITLINEMNATDYMTYLAQMNARGYVEDHGDWNDLMASPATDILGMQNALQGLTFYPDTELNLVFSDKTVLKSSWLAIYKGGVKTPNITTADDFYSYFVKGFTPNGEDYPAQWWPSEYTLSADSDSDDDQDPAPDLSSLCKGGSPLVPNWCQASNGSITAYPNNPVVAHKQILTTQGAVTGYIFKDISTGVLSIPTFDYDTDGYDDFNEAVEYFIGNASSTEHVIIDLQGNLGGDLYLAFSTFRQFFLPSQPFTGSRIRSHPMANILGNSYSQWWQDAELDDQAEYADSEWVVLNRFDVLTEKLFASWQEYSVPSNKTSRWQAYNLTDPVFYKQYFGTTEFNNGRTKPRWPGKNITLLTDGTCSSACALFVEFMTRNQTRTISVGGNPRTGPMQTASGTRGAASYLSRNIDIDYNVLRDTIQDTEAANRLPLTFDPDMRLNIAQINIRDQMRENNTYPLQFIYDASDCRIFYTLKNVYNMTQLWRDAATATWADDSLCVLDSTGYSDKVPKSPIPHNYTAPSLPTGDNERPGDISNGHLDGKSPKEIKLKSCEDDHDCKPLGKICQSLDSTCSHYPYMVCVDPCNSYDGDRTIPTCNKIDAIEGYKYTYTKDGNGNKVTHKHKRYSGWTGPTTKLRPTDVKGTPHGGCPKTTSAKSKPTASAKPKHTGSSGSSPSRFINHGLNFDGE